MTASRTAGRAGAPDWIRREGGGFAALLLACAVVFAALPFGRLVIAALAPGWTWNPAAALSAATGRLPLIATWNTIETAIVSGFGALALGSAFALTLAITDIRGKRILAFLFVMSLMVAPQVAALAYKTLAGPASPVLNAIGLAPAPGTPNPMLGRFGVMAVLALHHAPLAAMTLAAGLRAAWAGGFFARAGLGLGRETGLRVVFFGVAAAARSGAAIRVAATSIRSRIELINCLRSPWGA